MPKTLIESFPTESRIAVIDGSSILNISECFMDTVQGENFAGIPSTFLRLQNCTLACGWCDTLEVWKQGNPYSVKELIEIFQKNGTLDKFKLGQNLIFTGGSPLLQQNALIELIHGLVNENSLPFIQIENECTRLPANRLVEYISIWNNSPKLSNSGMRKELRYKPDILKFLSKLENSWFKFVISNMEDWSEIQRDFLDTNLIRKDQIVIMPEGQTREQLQKNYNFVVKMAVEHNVRMSDRMHVTIWNKKTGV